MRQAVRADLPLEEVEAEAELVGPGDVVIIERQGTLDGDFRRGGGRAARVAGRLVQATEGGGEQIGIDLLLTLIVEVNRARRVPGFQRDGAHVRAVQTLRLEHPLRRREDVGAPVAVLRRRMPLAHRFFLPPRVWLKVRGAGVEKQVRSSWKTWAGRLRRRTTCTIPERCSTKLNGVQILVDRTV